MTGINEKKPLLSNFTKIDQVGIVVNDLERTMDLYEQLFGIEPFLTLESPVNSAKLKIGLFFLGDIQVELIQVLEGKTIHSEFLEKRGEGFHHLAFFVDNIEKELKSLEKGGIKVLERGRVLDEVKYAYLDTEKLLGVVLELIQFD